MGNGKCHCTYNIINNTSFLNKKIFIDIAKVLQEQIRNINELISCNLNAYLIPTKSLICHVFFYFQKFFIFFQKNY